MVLTALNVDGTGLYVHGIELEFHLAGYDGVHPRSIPDRLIPVQCDRRKLVRQLCYLCNERGTVSVIGSRRVYKCYRKTMRVNYGDIRLQDEFVMGWLAHGKESFSSGVIESGLIFIKGGSKMDLLRLQ